jgi:hypothetical protein
MFNVQRGQMSGRGRISTQQHVTLSLAELGGRWFISFRNWQLISLCEALESLHTHQPQPGPELNLFRRCAKSICDLHNSLILRTNLHFILPLKTRHSENTFFLSNHHLRSIAFLLILTLASPQRVYLEISRHGRV